MLIDPSVILASGSADQPSEEVFMEEAAHDEAGREDVDAPMQEGLMKINSEGWTHRFENSLWSNDSAQISRR